MKLNKFLWSSLVLFSLSAVGAIHANASSTTINQNNQNVAKVQQNNKAQKAPQNLKVNFNNNSNVNHNHKQRKTFKKVFKVAKHHLGNRYAYGANGPHEFDCAAFTKYVYKHGAHINLPRTAGAQKYFCHRVSEKHAKAGDLVFFGYGHNIRHVGMYIGHGKMIDAQLRGVIIEKVHEPWWSDLNSFGRVPRA